MEKIRKHITVTGRVQGVGFRYHIRAAANRFGVTGWVRNRYDGAVEMELEGIREDIDAVLDYAANTRWTEVSGIDSRVIPVQGEAGFEIR